jgi:GNAT superfamily N-acetyltransferase
MASVGLDDEDSSAGSVDSDADDYRISLQTSDSGAESSYGDRWMIEYDHASCQVVAEVRVRATRGKVVLHLERFEDSAYLERRERVEGRATAMLYYLLQEHVTTHDAYRRLAETLSDWSMELSAEPMNDHFKQKHLDKLVAFYKRLGFQVDPNARGASARAVPMVCRDLRGLLAKLKENGDATVLRTLQREPPEVENTRL